MSIAAMSLPQSAQALQADISWQASPSAGVVGYILQVGSSSGNYTTAIDVGNVLTYQLQGMTYDSNYYLAVKAYSSTAMSVLSNEIVLRADTQPPVVEPPTVETTTPVVETTTPEVETTSPGVDTTSQPPFTTQPPITETTSQVDTDADGLSDAQEIALGTNPNMVDTDNDGVSDGQELLDQSNPLDRGSFIAPLATTVCADWNGFLDRMYNVMEHVNTTSTVLRVRSVLYNSSGKQMSRTNFSIAPGSQYDLLVHDMSGWQVNSVGKVCSSHSGVAGDMDGRMAYYKVETDALKGKSYQFAFAMPFTNSIVGKQYVSFNTYQPSLAVEDQANVVANWIQLTNRGNQKERGVLTFYNQGGDVISKRDITLQAGARIDVSAHNYGQSIVGLVEWAPLNARAGFEMRNVRYVYDNPDMSNSFAAAFQLEGLPGTFAEVSVPLSSVSQTAVLELANVSSENNEVVVAIHAEDGSVKKEVSLRMAPFATYHLIADEILRQEDGSGSAGLAIVKSNNQKALLATAMHYARNSDGSIAYMYGIDARESLGAVLSGSYNTFLTQKSILVVTNMSDTPQGFSFSLTRSGSKLSASSSDSEWSVPARGSITIDLNTFLTGDQYGVIRLTPANLGSLTAWVLRQNSGNYVMSTILRTVG